MKHIFAAVILLILLSPSALAQIRLPPAQTTFYILPVILSTCLDYTNTRQFLCLQGDFNSLTVSWNSSYFDGSEKNIGAKCYFNCQNAGDSIETDCASVQKCEFFGLVGYRSCVISNPQYTFNLPPNNFNNITCRFYDPNTYDETGAPLEFKPYPSRKFKPVDYTLSVSPVTVNVGEQFNFPLSVIPLGLISSVYTFNVTELSEPNALFIESNIVSTDKLNYGQAERFSPKVVYLISRPTNIQVLVNASSYSRQCSSDSDCSYIGDAKCVKDKSGATRCWKKLDLQLKAGKASLSEYDIFGFLQIMLLSVVILLLINFKKRK